MKTFLRKTALAWIAAMLTLAVAAAPQTGSFGIGNKTFLLNGSPFVVKAAEVHYPRIPRAYWDHRIKMCKALGMNTLCIYIFWNIHEQEEGVFDFSNNNDIRAFVQLAQKNGMYVIVRPGPYVCAEWEMGGLPWWLLKKKDIRLRERDPYFMEALERFEKKVGEQLADLTIDKGGPIIMVQVENEYGSYGEDKPYIAAVRDIVRKSGFDKVELFQCDWSSNFTKNGLDDLTWTMNFGTGANIDNEFRRLSELRPNSPLMCSEFWSGWFDKWGGRHETRGAKAMVDGIREMLERGISFSLYMTHGGTNWGHWAGANSPGFAPDVTSYDYDAPINEAGQTTPKYFELRNMMQQFSKTKLPDVPKAKSVVGIPKIKCTEVAPLFDNLPAPIEGTNTMTFEQMNQGWGCVLYRTHMATTITNESVLTIDEAHDYAQVFLNGTFIGTVDRIKREKDLRMPALQEGDVLDIYVEALGRINFGRAIKDFKGITEGVTLSYQLANHSKVTIALKSWQMFPLDDAYERQRKMNYVALTDANMGVRGNYRATFKLDKVGDTFLNMETWGKGQVYVNGHPIGRFWNIGPQQTLYMPGCWLKKGENELIVTDVVGPSDACVEGLRQPIIDRLKLDAPQTHRLKGQKLSLAAEKPVHKGKLAQGNGWQTVRFDSIMSGRYFCLEALDSHTNREYCCIAELYLLDENGKRLSRESWSVPYADDEDVRSGNKNADKVFDLQESTYWSTTQGVPFPHHIIIDMSQDQRISGFEILPRMEEGAPESIHSYRVFVKRDPFIF
ncbi:MAG: beta-galactosidase [Bacteroidales bacterium]|nr:beta-galactosidase [Candidatus Physcousia equi]